MSVSLQQNSTSDFGSALVSPSYDDVDAIFIPQNLPPLMIISLQSREPLEITVTKSFVNVLNNVYSAFSDLSSSGKKDVMAPIVVKNHLGKDVSLFLESRGFKYRRFRHKSSSESGKGSMLELGHGQDVQLVLSKVSEMT